MKLTAPVTQKRLEATAVLVCSLYLYHYSGFSWLFFALTFALPDLSILGYLKSKSFGAFTYNLIHCFIWPILLLVAGLTTETAIAQQLGLVWLAHCAFDRTIGWGLKYEDSFCHTDLGVRQLPINVGILK